MGYEEILLSRLQSLQHSSQVAEQEKIANEIHHRLDRRMPEFLWPLLESESENLRSWALYLLSSIPDLRSLPHLEQAYLQGRILPSAYLRSLRRIGFAEVLPMMLRMAQRQDVPASELARMICYELGRMIGYSERGADRRAARTMKDKFWSSGSSYEWSVAMNLVMNFEMSKREYRRIEKRFIASQDPELIRDFMSNVVFLTEEAGLFSRNPKGLKAKAYELLASENPTAVNQGLNLLTVLGEVPERQLLRDIYRQHPSKAMYMAHFEWIQDQYFHSDNWFDEYPEDKAFVLEAIEAHPAWLLEMLGQKLLSQLDDAEQNRLQRVIEMIPQEQKLPILKRVKWSHRPEWLYAQLMPFLELPEWHLEALTMLAENGVPQVVPLLERQLAQPENMLTPRYLEIALLLTRAPAPKLCTAAQVQDWLLRGLANPTCRLFIEEKDGLGLFADWPELKEQESAILQAARGRLEKEEHGWLDIQQILRQHSDPAEAIVRWLPLTLSKNSWISATARSRLKIHCSESPLPELINWLASEEPEQQLIALEFLHPDQIDQVGDHLISLLESPVLNVQYEALEAVERLKLTRALPILMRLQECPENSRRLRSQAESVMRSLRRSENKQALAWVRKTTQRLT